MLKNSGRILIESLVAMAILGCGVHGFFLTHALNIRLLNYAESIRKKAHEELTTEHKFVCAKKYLPGSEKIITCKNKHSAKIKKLFFRG